MHPGKLLVPIALFLKSIISNRSHPQRRTPPSFKMFSPKERLKIIIVGDEAFTEKTKVAFSYLGGEERVYFRSLVGSFISVVESVEKGSRIIGWPDTPYPRFLVGRATSDSHPVWYASALVHDACHSLQFAQERQGLDIYDICESNDDGSDTDIARKLEREALSIQYDFLKTWNYVSESKEDFVNIALKTEFWKVKDRWW